MSTNHHECHFCGQVLLETEGCTCEGATRERKIQHSIKQAVEASKKLFGAKAVDHGFRSKTPEEILPFLERCFELVAYEYANSIAIDIDGVCKAKIGIGANDKIEVERIETVKQKL